MYLLIDNYDSFTYNLWHYVREAGPEIEVFRNDAITPGAALARDPQGIIISPGPCDPDRAGICLDLIAAAAGKVKVLGVCLGHQSIGQCFGARVVPAPVCMHGKTSRITHNDGGVFTGLAQDFIATRYHSLAVAPDSVPDCLDVTARAGDGVIMGLCHKRHEIHGVQFHPESIASEHGHQLIENFLKL